MRIVIRSVPAGEGERLRVYAEYRVFSRLGSMAREINAVRVAVHRLRQRYGDLLRREVAHTVASEAEVDEELRYLLRVLST